MGNCSVFHDEVRFDIRDPEFNHVYVFIRAEGDCPFFVYGWHHKAFPKAMMPHEIMALLADGKEDSMQWEREAPRPVETPVIFNPWERVPVPVEQLQAWHDALVHGDSTRVEMADQIAGHLAMSPEWRKTCPYCRAEEAVLKQMREQQQ